MQSAPSQHLLTTRESSYTRPGMFKEVSGMDALTREQVIATFGPLDDVIVKAIIGMGPTLGELSEAKAWIANDEAFMNSANVLHMDVWVSWLKFYPQSTRRRRMRRLWAEPKGTARA